MYLLNKQSIFRICPIDLKIYHTNDNYTGIVEPNDCRSRIILQNET